MIILRFSFISLFFVNLLFANSNLNSITVAIASNISYAFPTLIKEFNKKNPNIKIHTIIGSSGKLTAQIKNYAPFDIFMSANMLYPNNLYKDGLTITKPIIYAKGLLAILDVKSKFIKKNYINNSSDIKFLLNKKIRKIAVANPKSAPYGTASIDFLKNSKLYNKLKRKIIYADSISQTLSYSMLVADIGIIAKSALYSKKMKRFKKDIHWIDIDEKLYTPIDQGIVLLKNGKNKKAVKKFYDFILGKEALKIFKSFGYKLN